MEQVEDVWTPQRSGIQVQIISHINLFIPPHSPRNPACYLSMDVLDMISAPSTVLPLFYEDLRFSPGDKMLYCLNPGVFCFLPREFCANILPNNDRAPALQIERFPPPFVLGLS